MSLMTNEDLQAVCKQLDQAIYNHEQWSKNLFRTLICRQIPDDHDLLEDAHRHCIFGQWYYEHAPASLHSYPGFNAIETVHQQLHSSTRRMLMHSHRGADISPEEYDQFAHSLDGLRLELMSLKRELQEQLFNRDPLTSAYTRLGMLTRLREQQAMLIRTQQASAIVILDLDHFKVVNDTWGHPAGDAVLVATAQCVRTNMRPYDQLFRFGGEEFLLSLPDTDTVAAQAIAERLRESIEQMATDYEGKTISITASFGVAPIDAALPVEETIEHADAALYAAKTTGRNRVVCWQPGMQTTV